MTSNNLKQHKKAKRYELTDHQTNRPSGSLSRVHATKQEQGNGKQQREKKESRNKKGGNKESKE